MIAFISPFCVTRYSCNAGGGAHIRVTFQVDADGLLSVSAMEKSTGVQASIQVKPSYGLTENEIASMLTASMTHARDDISARKLAEQKVDGLRVLESLAGALAEDAALLSEDEQQAITAAQAALREAIAGSDAERIAEEIKQLDQVTQNFAAQRMDKSIRQALTGHSVDEV